MTQEQILGKAIEKAIKNGYDIKDRDYNNATGCESMGYLDTIQMSRVLCFSHQFAKAFWRDNAMGWEHYLQEMVLDENPISYIERFI